MTGMFETDGIDLAGLVAEHLGPRVLPATIHRPGASGARDPDDLTAAPARAAPTDHTCRGFIEDFSTDTVASGFVQVGDRKITVLGATISPVIVPQGGPEGDEITIDGARYRIEKVLSRDPAGATYVLQARTR